MTPGGVTLGAVSSQMLWWAHAGEAGGVEVEWLIVGAGLLVAAGLLYRSMAGTRWVPVVLAVLGAASVAGAFLIPRAGDDTRTSNAVVEIVQPGEGERVAAGEPVTVRVALRNGKLARTPESETGGHLHLYVDGKLQQMPYSKQMEVELEPGVHELTVEYVDAQHLSFDPPVQRTVEVTAR